MDKLISVAIPCYKSSKTIGAVVKEIKDTINARSGFDYQIILVNDYPYDNTFSVIANLCKNDSKIIGVNLSKNFGQAYAKMAALQYVSGDVLVYMDDDGQHPAKDIFKLVDKIYEGYDVVYAYFPHKRHSLFKRLTSAIYGKLCEWNGTKPKGITVTSYYALSSLMIEALKNYKSPFPGVSGYMHCITTKYTNVALEHRERLEGSSNYTLPKLVSLWTLVFFNYSLLPLRIASVVGGFCSILGFGYGIYIIIRRLLFNNITAGFTSIIAIMLFIGGLIMLMLGIIGEYIGRIYMTVNDKPQVVIREVINDSKHKETII